AGIASSALDDDAAFAELPLAHGVLDDEQGGAILDRLPRIHEFGLTQDGASRRLGGALKGDQRSIADGPDNSVARLHWPVRRVRKGAERRGPHGSRQARQISVFRQSGGISG